MASAMIVHLTARTRVGFHLLGDVTGAWRLWRKLRRTWPKAIAAALMDNHLHLLVRAAEPLVARRALAAILAGHTRHIRESKLWLPVPNPTPLATTKHVLRSVRYILLNPVRAGLVGDPVAWPFSVHRGLVGAEFVPWTPIAELARELHRPARSAAEWLHRYVSSDAETNPAGTPLPVPAVPLDPSTHNAVSLDRIAAAAASATPWSSLQERRHLLVLLARHQGLRSTSAIAEAAGIGERYVRRLSGESNPALLSAGALCLGDPRLLLPSHLQSAPVSHRVRSP